MCRSFACFFLLLFLVGSFSQNLLFAWNDPEVIYGKDNRKDLYQLRSSDKLYKNLAASTALLTSTSRISSQPQSNHLKIKVSTLLTKNHVCPDEPFSDQPVGGWCSGFLAAPDILVTAGHCIPDERQCRKTSIIFGYSMHRADSRPSLSARKDHVYKCQSIIGKGFKPPRGADYVVIRLDRPVRKRAVLQIRREGFVSEKEELTIIGHPSGLPTKVATGAWVRENSESKKYFITNTDSYEGNSGSAVFNEDGIVEGILVRGESDYEWSGNCFRSKRCVEDGCRGEDVIRSQVFSHLIPEITNG